MTTAAAGVSDSMDYLPYGELVSGGSGTTHKFTGKERDNESGLDNFGARYDSSNIGRFMSPDPILIMPQKLGDPQQWNMYSYVRNNPLNLTDPTGMYTVSCGSGVKDCDKKMQKFDDSLKKAGKSKNEKVRKAAEAYGKRGDDNGVNVTLVKKVDKNDDNGLTHNQAGTPGYTYDSQGNSFKQATQVDIKADLSGNELEETAVHEGVHTEDRENFVDTFVQHKGPDDFSFNADYSLNIFGRQSEVNAFGVENLLRQELGDPIRDIQKILSSPPYSNSPSMNQPLFPGLVRQ